MGVIDPRDERYEDDRPGGIGRVAGAEPSERDEAPRRGEPAADDADAPPARRRYDDDVPRRRDDDDAPRRRDEDDVPRRRSLDDEERPVRRVEWRAADEDERPRRRDLDRYEPTERPSRREPSAWEQRGGRYDDESRPRRRYDEDDAPRRSRAGEEEVDHRAVIILAAIALGALLIAASGALR
jgi:23S rRNA pseudouridine2604 synthase